MYNKEIKVAVSSLLVLFALLCIYPLKIYWLTPLLILLAAIIILTIFRNEHNLTAFYYLRKNAMVKSQEALDRIKFPEKLIKSQEAYHYYLRGLILSQKEPLKGEKFFLKALNTGLRMDTDRAVCKLNLAAVALQKRKKQQAIQLISEAKKLDKQGMLKEQISMLNGQMKFI
jgi:hypothetical protein